MKLLLKFNLVLLLVFAVGLVTTGFICRRLLRQNAKAEIMDNARIMMEAAIAVRTVNRATDWEADIIEEFRKVRDKTEIIGERDTPNGRTLYMARPLKVSSPACLTCHDTVEGAPRTMVERYRTKHPEYDMAR